MINQAVFALVDEFDRVFDRDDVIAPVLVGIVHHRRQRGGFAGAGRAGHHDQATVEHAELLQHTRQGRIELLKVVKGEHLGRNLAKCRANAVFLVIEIGPEPGDVRDLIPEINVADLLKDLDFVFRRNLVQHLFKLVVLKGRMVHPMQFAIDPQHGVIPRGKVQVRRLLLEHQIEECIDFRHKRPYSCTPDS